MQSRRNFIPVVLPTHTMNYLLFTLLTAICAEKFNPETLNNYSEFLNFGVKKLKFKKESLENSIIKSKVDVLGELLKKNLEGFKNYNKLEIIFLIDASSSVGEENFRSELKFVKKLLSDVTVDYNHTRVAIVTFSSSVTTNIDQITQPRKENNKCFLLTKLLNEIQYSGGGTHTQEAFKTAKEIFQFSRNDSQKVLFLITDGFSNGGDPIPVAADLKKSQVTIFTIGIQNGNYRELYELASSPGELYSYLLDSFQEFESLARRALHVDLKSGDYIPLGINSPCSKLCPDGDCCDKNALCTCGSTSGHYSCICQPGFYGTGLKNSCSPCPLGHYSDGPHFCRPCPDMHHTTIPPASGVESCICKPGYKPTKTNLCKILKCPRISTPQHGYFVKKRDCGNVVNSACGVRCEVGYTLVGSSIRLCQEDATWSGEEPSCQIKTCTMLPPPAYGSISCSHADLGVTYNTSEENLPVDTVCTFQCQDGKTLIGSSQRTCLPLARWDGLKTSCKQIKCSKLPAIRNGQIEPPSCMIGRQSYGKKCKISCDEGFELAGPAVKTCTSNHGLWDTPFESTTCRDVIPPSIICPDNITAETQPGKQFGSVFWEKPHATDNADLDVSVWMKPSIRNISEFQFPIGKTQITYFAQDAFRNRAKCLFFVEIKDYESPVIEDCNSPPIFLSNEADGANVTWDEPNIFDNSQNFTIQRSHDFGFLPIGTTRVEYKVTDGSGNENSCKINITIEVAQCEALLDPIFGYSDCSSLEAGMQCVITCQEGYAVPLSQPIEENPISFMCNHSESVWYNQEGLMFPECSVTEIPKEVIQTGSVKITTDLESCSSEKLNDLENDIKLSLEDSCRNCSINTNTICEEDSEEETNIIKREVSFEELPHRNTSRRRAKKKKVNVKFQVKGRYINQTEEITVGNQTLPIHHNQVKFICPPGFIPRKNRCVQCPKGTFHNMTRNRCQSCPLGSYSDKLGQLECKSCPKYHSTRKLHSKKQEDCKEMCPPGTHARKKLIKQHRRHHNVTIERATLKPYCRSCSLGAYQPQYSQMRCLPCPKGYTTLASRATSISLCIPTAPEICSRNPSLCNSGICNPNSNFQYTCECPKNYIGTHCEKKVTGCESNPCVNNGICKESESGFKCLCPRGYSGLYCQDSEEKCLLICLNNGTCHFNEPDEYFCWCPPGYGGESCEFKLTFCKPNLCENNGSCVERPNGFRCVCPDGFIGKRCNLLPCDYQPCGGNSICVNLIEVNTTKESYRCVCPEGYTGSFCSEKINFCAGNPCQNGATCVSTSSSYNCTCPRFFYGSNCESLFRSDYVLNFQKFSTTDYIKLDGFRSDLSAITACLWMQTRDKINYGTLLSYATKNYDNAFTLTDYTGLVLYVNNNYIVTDILLNDGLWHHVCVSWSTNGSYNLYVDGATHKQGDLAPNATIQGNGNLVIGQEQDVLGGRFSQSETFIGRMAYIDIWTKQLSSQDIAEHMNDCGGEITGDWFAWPEVQNHVLGNVLIENSSFCMKCEEPKTLYNGIINVVDNVAYYECYKGFELTGADYKEGRRCTKAAKWEGLYEPYCKRIYCGYPGYIRNGYTIGAKYYFQEKITYRCHEGYDLVGNSTVICTENGTWYPQKPQCAGLQCVAFSKPEHSKLVVLAEHSYEDFIANHSTFDIGTQVEITCEENSALKGEMIITCTENGTWDFGAPHCLPRSLLGCDISKVPPAPENGLIVADSLNLARNGSANTVEYKCLNGFKLIGDNSTTCIIDGYWTEPNISCKAIQCPTPAFPNMILKAEQASYFSGNAVKFECIEGYKIFGDGTIRCSSSGRWSRMRAKCSKRSCRKPAVKESTIIEGNSYLFEDQVTLICANKKQYTLTCNSFGEWIGEKDTTC